MKKRLLSLMCASLLLQVSVPVFAQESASSESSASAEQTPAPSETADWSALEAELKLQLEEGDTLTQQFAHNEPITIEKDGISFTIKRYAYYVAESAQNPGMKAGLLLVDGAYNNTTANPYYAPAGFYGSIVGFDSAVSSLGVDIESEELSLFKKLMAMDQTMPPNTEVSGSFVLAIAPDAFNLLEQEGFLTFEFPDILPTKDSSLSDAIIRDETTFLAISEAGKAKVDAAKAFYADAVSKENLGTKTLIEEKKDLGTQTFQDIDVAVNGVQITDFVPNAEEAPRFESFKDGVVLVTLDLSVTNNSDSVVRFDNTSSWLILNENIKLLNEGMLEVRQHDHLLEKGQSGQVYMVFALSKDDYELYKERSMTVDVTLFNEEFQRINETEPISFTIR